VAVFIKRDRHDKRYDRGREGEGKKGKMEEK
jgi:hypothetical protein